MEDWCITLVHKSIQKVSSSVGPKTISNQFFILINANFKIDMWYRYNIFAKCKLNNSIKTNDTS